MAEDLDEQLQEQIGAHCNVLLDVQYCTVNVQ